MSSNHSRNREGRTCTCAGSAPGWPQHEIGCGGEPAEPTGRRCCGWVDGVCENCPTRRSWNSLEDIPVDVLRVTDSAGGLIGRTTDGRWARMDTTRFTHIVPLDAHGTFTEVKA